MRKKITSIMLFVSLVISTLSLSSCGEVESKNPERPDSIPVPATSVGDLYSDAYRVVAENDNLILYYNDGSTDIKVKNKKTGYVWSSEYYDSSMDEYTKGQIFNIQYTDTAGAEQTKSSAEDSIDKGQFVETDIERGVKVQYGVGDIGYEIKFPMALSPEKYEELSAKMNDDQLYVLEDNYELYDFTDKEFTSYYKADELKLMKKSYPKAVDGPWYYMTSKTDYDAVNELNTVFKELNYSEDDIAEDNDGITLPELDSIEFNVSIYYTLTDDGLSVKIPEKEIYYNEDYPMESLQILPDFMDFDNSYNGYFLLPDGSGSIMNFNNNKEQLRDKSVYVQMYGVDNSRVVEEKTAYYNDAIFPVFGTCIKGKNGNNLEKNYNGVFGIIESGETFAGIEANNFDADAGKHNNMQLEFRINERVRMDAFTYSDDDQSKYCKYQFQRYLGDIQFSYHFLSGSDATYSGMANYYSNYLFGNTKTEVKDYYSTVETVGLINTTDLFFGIEYNTKKALTTFSQVDKIANELYKNGFKNMNIKLSGWCNGGYEHGWIDNLKVSKQLGDEEELTNLVNDLKKKNIGVYPDVDFQNVYASEATPKTSDVAASLNGYESVVTKYSPIDYTQVNKLSKYVLTMNATIENFTGFMDDYKKLGINNISYRSIGSEINSNFRDDEEYMERQETLKNLVKLLKSASDDGYNVMGSGGQAAYLKYLDVINEMPIESAHYDKCDYSVPFTAMVLSGHVDYTYQPINLSNNNRKDLLQLVESGSGAYYVLTNNYYEEISNTSYDNLYSTVFNDIKDEVYDSYSYVSEALDGVYGLKIVKHEQLAKDVYKTTYENGTSIYVNYSNNAYTANGIKVAAQDYLKVKGDAK